MQHFEKYNKNDFLNVYLEIIAISNKYNIEMDFYSIQCFLYDSVVLDSLNLVDFGLSFDQVIKSTFSVINSGDEETVSIMDVIQFSLKQNKIHIIFKLLNNKTIYNILIKTDFSVFYDGKEYHKNKKDAFKIYNNFLSIKNF